VEDPGDVEATVRAALDHDGPSLVDVISQPLEESAVPVSRWMG
jgi:acetolactate synthase-1/2/3 large subunit